MDATYPEGTFSLLICINIPTVKKRYTHSLDSLFKRNCRNSTLVSSCSYREHTITLLQHIQEEHLVLALQFTKASGAPSDHCQPASSSRWFRPIHSIPSVAFNCPGTERIN